MHAVGEAGWRLPVAASGCRMDGVAGRGWRRAHLDGGLEGERAPDHQAARMEPLLEVDEAPREADPHLEAH